MADFDQFESSEPQQNVEEDPAAAFLAREQTELAGLEDDNFGVDQSAPQEQNGFDPFGGEGNTDQADFMGQNQDENNQENQENMMNGYGGGSGGGLLDFDSAPMMNGDTAETNGPTDAYSAISQVDRERTEPEQIRIWREAQKKRLEEKDAEEEQKRSIWQSEAKKELDDWYKHHSEQLEKTKSNNKESEHAFVKERDEKQPGGEWEKICRLCEFNPKNSKNTKDVSRMRSILLQLKQTPLVR